MALCAMRYVALPITVFSLLIGAVDNGAVLNIGVIADCNQCTSPRTTAFEPHRAVITHHHLAYYRSIVSQKTICSELR